MVLLTFIFGTRDPTKKIICNLMGICNPLLGSIGPIVWWEGTDDGIRGVQSVESGDLDASALPVVLHMKRVILIR